MLWHKCFVAIFDSIKIRFCPYPYFNHLGRVCFLTDFPFSSLLTISWSARVPGTWAIGTERMASKMTDVLLHSGFLGFWFTTT